jgi:hypothetical protein
MTFPAAATFSIASNPTSADFATALEAFLATTKQLPGGTARSELTISSGVIVPTAATHTVDTEADGATDDLANIQYTNMEDGTILILYPENTGRVVTIKHMAGGVGQINMLDAVDFVHTVPVILQRIGSVWYELLHTALASTSAALQAQITTISAWIVRAAGGSSADSYTGVFAAGVLGYDSLKVAAKSPASMKVSVTGGLFAVAAIPYLLASATDSDTMTAPITNPRKDLISISPAGAIVITSGVEAASPALPATPSGNLALAQIYHRVGSIHIDDTDDTSNSYITNLRHFIN